MKKFLIRLLLTGLITSSTALAIECDTFEVDSKIKIYAARACIEVNIKDKKGFYTSDRHTSLPINKSGIYINGTDGFITILFNFDDSKYKFTTDNSYGNRMIHSTNFLNLGAILSSYRNSFLEEAFKQKDDRLSDLKKLKSVIEIYSSKTKETVMIQLDGYGQTKGDVIYISPDGKYYLIGKATIGYIFLNPLGERDLKGNLYTTPAGLAAKFLKIKF